MIATPQAGDYTDEMWRTVAELVKVVNALQNMVVAGQDSSARDITGKLEMNDGGCTIHIRFANQGSGQFGG